ncbi:MAG: hypothetical protein E6614_08765, partial [Bradyrhizobium sp.]|nr:hypothetical protein [Bradyrhizobium sp.]
MIDINFLSLDMSHEIVVLAQQERTTCSSAFGQFLSPFCFWGRLPLKPTARGMQRRSQPPRIIHNT